MPAPHDRGGWPTDEPIEQSEHVWADWEQQTSALVGILRRKELISVDELRAGIEAMDPSEYESATYFERWSASIETALVAKGVLTTDEIDARAAALNERWHAR